MTEEKQSKTIENRSTKEQIESYLQRINDLLGLESGSCYDVNGLSVEGNLKLVWKKASENLHAEDKVPKHLLQFFKGFDSALHFIKRNPEFLEKFLL